MGRDTPHYSRGPLVPFTGVFLPSLHSQDTEATSSPFPAPPKIPFSPHTFWKKMILPHFTKEGIRARQPQSISSSKKCISTFATEFFSPGFPWSFPAQFFFPPKIFQPSFFHQLFQASFFPWSFPAQFSSLVIEAGFHDQFHDSQSSSRLLCRAGKRWRWQE